MSWKEDRSTMLGMLMYRLGFVRRRDYEELCERYERLYGKYLGKRMEMDRLFQELDHQKREQMKASASAWREGGAV